jgi:AraC family transcriptional regulator, regulatory protein of adaptative response / methylated-DNA-[protein]-cysteine methyltransferase
MLSTATCANPPEPSSSTDDSRWQAVQRRDTAADGTFYYSVRTTGVYCRPSCASRPALRENVAFHATCAAADAAGFRPCKRCRPNEATAAVHFAIAECWLGAILVAASAKGIRAILLGDDPAALRRDLEHRFPRARLVEGGESVKHLTDAVIDCIEAPEQAHDLPLDPQGTEFEQRVWRELRDIPPGATASYSEIAARIGAPTEAYAVGEACAANMIAVAIPCHRVVRKDGGLAGYRWGFKRKRALLKREGAR